MDLARRIFDFLRALLRRYRRFKLLRLLRQRAFGIGEARKERPHLLTLPPEIRNIIWKMVLTRPGQQHLVFRQASSILDDRPQILRSPIVSHVQSLEDDRLQMLRIQAVVRGMRPMALLNSNAGSRSKNASREPLWRLVQTNKQIYRETIAMVSGLNTVVFEAGGDLRLFVSARQPAVLLAHLPRRHLRFRGVHLDYIRDVKVTIDPSVSYRVREMSRLLWSFRSLERVVMGISAHGLKEERDEAILLQLTRRDILPKLRECRLEVLMDKDGVCKLCLHGPCTVWRAATERESAIAGRINWAVAVALAGRARVR